MAKQVNKKPKVDETKLVTVIGTKESPYMKTEKEYQVTKKLADTLVKNGQATIKK